ncbi:hypothetical protein [Marinifilum flexuosum]|uniref:Uncharacterized protein n=1 Tax=Marinifilum flexuosum TaxID=1117708 RepID=A0A419WMS6_9BACT|nr:hypothetical protein [Marinifilum flexuosum]RKD96761.1 hypothetical protein BXY64_3707 [Marinifilum flexuosum]
MKKQYYFASIGAEYCYTKEYFIERMKQEGLEEIEVYKAVPDTEKGIFWCKAIQECGVDSSSSCGTKNCEDYEPRNGKNGCCKHYSTRVYRWGEAVKLTLN